jgi:hypothetical protein
MIEYNGMSLIHVISYRIFGSLSDIVLVAPMHSIDPSTSILLGRPAS